VYVLDPWHFLEVGKWNCDERMGERGQMMPLVDGDLLERLEMGRDCLQSKVRVVEWWLLGPSPLLFLVLRLFFPFLFLWPAPIPFLFNFLGSFASHDRRETEHVHWI
jgi:hypothetical protein